MDLQLKNTAALLDNELYADAVGRKPKQLYAGYRKNQKAVGGQTITFPEFFQMLLGNRIVNRRNEIISSCPMSMA